MTDTNIFVSIKQSTVIQYVYLVADLNQLLVRKLVEIIHDFSHGAGLGLVRDIRSNLPFFDGLLNEIVI